MIDKGFRELDTWCRRRVLVLQNEHLAKLAKTSLTSQVTRKLNSIEPDADVDETNDVDEAPSWVKHLIAAVKQPPKPPSGTRPAKPMVDAVQVAAAKPAVMDLETAVPVDLLLRDVRNSLSGAASAINVGPTPSDGQSARPSRK